VQGLAEFEFDLAKALRVELINLLDTMETGPLTATVASRLPEVQGVYQLFYMDKLTYIGKTDAESGLRTRLTRHARKTLQRPTLTAGVRFKAVRIMVFSAMDLETQLLNHYRGLGGPIAVPWNGSGFGANDPGRERETTNRRPDGFDALYPIDIDLAQEWLPPGTTVVADALANLKAVLPYTLRYETLRNAQGRAQRGQPHEDLRAATVLIPPTPQTVRNLMRLFCASLGPAWQATVFAGHVILYKENRDYAYGQLV
jgi:hypothetical protein